MRSLSGGGLDEAHCFWPMCPHPCCWEAEQRILQGKPRLVKAQTSSRATTTVSEVDGFPTLSVVNASEWAESRKSPEVKSLFKSRCDDDVSKGISWEASPRGARRHVNTRCPDYNSATTTLPERNREDKTIKLGTAQISPLPSCTSASQSSEAIVMWVPNSHHIPPRHGQNSAKSRQVAVKELMYLPPAELYKSGDKKKSWKWVKSAERVGERNGETPLMSQMVEEGIGSLRLEPDTDLPDPGLVWPSLDGDRQADEAAAPLLDRRRVPVDQMPVAAPEAENGRQPPRAAEAFRLETKPVGFHAVWERIQRRHTQEDHPDYKYKLDTKTGVNGIDWESLRQQTYLWRKHIHPANRERGKPSSSEGEAGYLPGGLHPVPKPTLRYRPRNPPSIGLAKCRCVDCTNGVWQSYSRILASKSKGCLCRRSDAMLKCCCASHHHQNPGQQAIEEEEQSDTEPDVKGALPPPNSKQSSQETTLLNQPITPEKLARSRDRTLSGFNPLPPPSSLTSDICEEDQR